jgi:hypothetical protein
MAYGLISSIEPVFIDEVEVGNRIAQIEQTEETCFPVADTLSWQLVPDGCVADEWYWNGTEAIEKPIPIKTTAQSPTPTEGLTTL